VPKQPTPEQLETFAENPSEGPLVMINLLRLAKGEGAGEYGEYAKKIAPIFARVGARMIYTGSYDSAVIGDPGESFDAIAIVEYPNREAFLGMLDSEAYQAIHPHRDRGLESQWLLASTPTVTVGD